MNKQQSPRLRFKGFMGEWDEKTLGDLGKVEMCRRIFKEQTQINGDIPFFKIGTFGQEPDAFISRELFEEYRQKYPYPKKGDILISAAGTIGRTVEFTGEDAYFQDSNIVWLRFDENQIISNFLSVTYQNIKWDLEGSTIKRLYNSDLLSAEINLPTLPEQTQLGNFFRDLDRLLTESRAVWEKSRQLKKAMLAKMFPANGKKIPEIRFKGFKGEWMETELGELGYCISGIGFPENEQGGENGIPFFKVSDMNLSGNEIYLRKSNNYVTQEQINKQRWQIINQLPCIFFAKVGAALLLNRKRLVNQPFLLDNNTMAFILNSNLDDYFMKTLFDTLDLPSLAQIGALPSINAKDVEKNIVFIPSPKEQTAIGNFFRQLDETIALQAAEIEKLSQLKKGLLAAMLV